MYTKNIPEFWEYTKELPEIYNVTNRIYYLVHNFTLEDITCKECKKNLCGFSNSYKTGFRKFCSAKCSRNSKETQTKQEATCIKKFGVKNPRQAKEVIEKIEKTNVKKYGSKSPLGNKKILLKSRDTLERKYGTRSAFCLESSKNSLIEKFGVDNAAKNQQIKDKMALTNKKKYGGTTPAKSRIVVEKMQSTCIEKYGAKTPLLLEEYREKGYSTIREGNYEKLIEELKLKQLELRMTKEEFALLKEGVAKLYCNNCKREFESEYTHAQRIKCGCLDKTFSYMEKELVNWLKSTIDTDVIESSFRIIPRAQLDIYLPVYKLAIEFDGIYWHSIEWKDQFYHINKTLACYAKGIELLHIFENEWKDNEQWVKEMILYKLGKNTQDIETICLNLGITQQDLRYFNKAIEPRTEPRLLEIWGHNIWDCGTLLYFD